MRFATRTFRSSVVKVVAAFVPLIGCADEHHPAVSNPPNVPPECEQPGCVPSLGDGGAPRDTSVDATARDATRDAVAPDSCPSSEPRDGDPCRLSRSENCEYGPKTPCGFSERTKYCVDGRWQTGISSCNPPYVPCPDDAPTEGEHCALAFGLTSCAYGRCAGKDAGVGATYLCSAGTWVVNQRCGDTTCPSVRPNNGAHCDYVGEGCEYDPCGSYFSTTARCLGTWQLSSTSCNPPPPPFPAVPLCPQPQPVQGADCQHDAGSSCYVMLGGGAVFAADCVNGKWQVHPPDAGS